VDVTLSFRPLAIAKSSTHGPLVVTGSLARACLPLFSTVMATVDASSQAGQRDCHSIIYASRGRLATGRLRGHHQDVNGRTKPGAKAEGEIKTWIYE
jgi:hypothetical protein